MFEGRCFEGDGCATHSIRPWRMTTREIAQRLGLPRSTVNRWYERREIIGFPEALGRRERKKMADPDNGLEFDWREVQQWYFFWKVTRRKLSSDRTGTTPNGHSGGKSSE